MHYLRNIKIKIKIKIKQTSGLTEIATLKFLSKRNPPVKPRLVGRLVVLGLTAL